MSTRTMQIAPTSRRPAMGAADRIATRGLPTHFVTLWVVDLSSGHGGRIGDLGLTIAVTLAYRRATAPRGRR